mgnify:CR=1 FL=1
MKSICIFLANGFEEIEALLPLDVMRRGGLSVKTVSVTGTRIAMGAHQIPVEADLRFEELNAEDVEMIVLPGGMPGAANLDMHSGLDKLIRYFAAEHKPMAAICAAPLVYGRRGLLNGKKATCYPGFEDELKGCNYKEELVVTDGNIITGRGPAAAVPFAFEILKHTKPEKVEEIKKGMLFNS